MSFDSYLRNYTKDKNNAAQIVTHTRIGSPEHNIYGGAYSVPPEKKAEFYHTYYHQVYLKNAAEYLTERQLPDDFKTTAGDIVNGAILVDLDFRYDADVTERQHTPEHVEDMVFEYVEELKKYFLFEPADTEFEVFVFEKPHVNQLEDKTKDGLHMIIGVQADHTIQRMLRETMMERLPQTVFTDLPLKNDWDTVFDEGISKGHTNWQLYGSRKPAHDTYKLRYHYVVTMDAADGQFVVETQPIAARLDEALFMRLTAQYEEHPRFPPNPAIKSAYDKFAQQNGVAKRRTPSAGGGTPTRRRIVIDDIDDESDDPVFTTHTNISPNSIKTAAQLDEAIELMLASFRQSQLDYDLPEIHEYAQILPDIFYRPGSHELNRKLAFALKHTDERMFLSWIKVRSKATDFDWGSIPKLYGDWKRHFNQSDMAEDRKLTKKSIIFWAKQYAFEAYERIKKTAISAYIDITLKHEKAHPEFDIAMVLYQLYKDEYVFVINGSTTEWYRYKDHRWRLDPKGTSLRKRISTELYNLYSFKQTQLLNEKALLKMSATTTSSTDAGETVDVAEVEKVNKDKDDFLRFRLSSISLLMIDIKSTSNKNNVMKEAQDLFLDDDFEEKRDENRYLLGFTNGVFDFKLGQFRAGLPEDYITLSTKHAYIPFDLSNEEFRKKYDEIMDFIRKIYPVEELRDYMLEHLGAAAIGVGPLVNQTCNFYLGTGGNGKTKITDLMKAALGDYCDKCSIQLITEDRGKMGAASPELIDIKGKRYIYMSEPRKGAVLCDGPFKELTGDPTLKARGLYKDIIEFANQATYAACMNNLLEVKTNDDGTWRRILVEEHMAKFVSPEAMEYARAENKYVYAIDPQMDAKIVEFGPYFVSIMVDIARKNGGKVKTCNIVMAASNAYRKSQDFICGFLLETVEKTGKKGDKIRKADLWSSFKNWYEAEYGKTKTYPIKSEELFTLMDKRFGACKNMAWVGVRIRFDCEEEDEDEIKAMRENIGETA